MSGTFSRPDGPRLIYKRVSRTFTLLATLSAGQGPSDTVAVKVAGPTTIINSVRQTPLVDSAHIIGTKYSVSARGNPADTVVFRNYLHPALWTRGVDPEAAAAVRMRC